MLAHSPEFVTGRKAAQERFARGEYGGRLDDVLAELDAEDKPDSPVPEVRVERAAKKDLKRIGPGPERNRIVAGLRRLAEDAPNLDVKTISGAAPGWFRLRIGEYRICG